jgi:membrane-associated HD superfamily phosphohydrolase
MRNSNNMFHFLPSFIDVIESNVIICLIKATLTLPVGLCIFFVIGKRFVSCLKYKQMMCFTILLLSTTLLVNVPIISWYISEYSNPLKKRDSDVDLSYLLLNRASCKQHHNQRWKCFTSYYMFTMTILSVQNTSPYGI